MIQLETFSPDNTYTYSFWTSGNAKNPPLFMLPGFTGTHEDLLTFVEKFTDTYFVIIPDFPGWGNSPVGSYLPTIAGYATFLHDLLHFLRVKKTVVMGHCMGATVAIEFASVYPTEVTQLFLIGTPFLQGSISDAFFHTLSHMVSKTPKLLRPLLFFFRSRLFAIPLGFFVIQTRSLKKKLSIIARNSIKQQFQKEDVTESNWTSLINFDYQKIAHLSLPIHIFHGEKDMLIPFSQASKLALLCQHATVESISRAGHMPPLETPQTLAHAIQRYLV